MQAGVGESCRGYCKNNGYDCDEEVQAIPCSLLELCAQGCSCLLAYVVVDSPAAQSPPAGRLTHASSLRMQSLCNPFGTFTHSHVGLHTRRQMPVRRRYKLYMRTRRA